MQIKNFMDLLVLSSNEGSANCINISLEEDYYAISGDIISVDIDLLISKTKRRVKRGDIIQLNLDLKNMGELSEKEIKELQGYYLDSCDNPKEMEHNLKWNKEFDKDIQTIFKKGDKIFAQCKKCKFYEKHIENIPYRMFRCNHKEHSGEYQWSESRLNCTEHQEVSGNSSHK